MLLNFVQKITGDQDIWTEKMERRSARKLANVAAVAELDKLSDVESEVAESIPSNAESDTFDTLEGSDDSDDGDENMEGLASAWTSRDKSILYSAEPKNVPDRTTKRMYSGGEKCFYLGERTFLAAPVRFVHFLHIIFYHVPPTR